ncbi:Crp/Fnr family transcriptional regulator [Sediminicoccus rosea]|uniref:Crp/Fnr family transcriptional regulator n=1 Tax=Sediminicoccus rosea TaxID=1225128 RepID=A0ABZ0PG27_9PROT|nr:Crp/Fnr family transcriptional regulator [Sediminicoccus rosea]WPB84231.1 Crp/Fnr family transcriptional regulator [Sediminicoccus rosea]
MDDLARFPFFRPFAAEALEALAGAARWHGFEPGQTVLEAGDPARDVFFIAEGEVRIVMRSAGGHEIILNELGPGQFFGEIAAIDGGPRSVGVVALTRARVCVIAAAPFMSFALSTPEASHQVMRMLAALVREKDARLLELTILPVRPRLIALLLRMSRPRVVGEGEGVVVSPPRPHHELAARIGTRREVVTRILGALTREGLASPGRGGLVLPDPATLIAEVETSFRTATGG